MFTFPLAFSFPISPVSSLLLSFFLLLVFLLIFRLSPPFSVHPPSFFHPLPPLHFFFLPIIWSSYLFLRSFFVFFPSFLFAKDTQWSLLCFFPFSLFSFFQKSPLLSRYFPFSILNFSFNIISLSSFLYFPKSSFLNFFSKAAFIFPKTSSHISWQNVSRKKPKSSLL